jgi:hypothetical protein
MVFKIEKNKNYAIMSNYHLRDKNLSLKAKGLLSFMLSLPENWDYSLSGLIAVCKEQESSIKSTLRELKNNGYLVIEKVRGEKGYFEYNYLIYELPIELEKSKDNPEGENPPVDNPEVGNRVQINTNKINTKEQIDKTDKTDKIDKTINDSQKSKFVYDNDYSELTNDLVKRGYLDPFDVEKVYYDNLFEEVLEDNDFKDIAIISHYIISRVIDRKFRDEDNNMIQNKFGYYKEALLSNIRKMKNNEIEWDDELGWFKELEEFNELNNDFYDDYDYPDY